MAKKNAQFFKPRLFQTKRGFEAFEVPMQLYIDIKMKNLAFLSSGWAKTALLKNYFESIKVASYYLEEHENRSIGLKK